MTIPLRVLSMLYMEDHGFSTKCYTWHGAVDSDGYALVKHNGSVKRLHRMAVDAPSDKEVDHLCRVRNCVRPSHLEIVDQAENKRRANALRFNK